MDSNPESNREEMQALHEKFREVKHSINNTLAVIMALSELAQRNTQHYEKLASTVLARCPDIVSQLQDFSRALLEKLKAAETAAGPVPASHEPPLSPP